ncbi:MAG TPA: PfkB family carbohydrate kinase [Dermatophilaceae bacterium]|jgi:rfaE bifunctional protein nucleotidyltransferase chain/domain/rfaE bifunctional protein kinase chain/domain|nr:PfkB family carbohydrate kinase [Dermatophilaceae bacterium]
MSGTRASTGGQRAHHRSWQVVVVGDVLLDRDVLGSAERLSPDAPVPVVDIDHIAERPGGAGLAALLCAAEGLDVHLVAPLARDDAGYRLAALLEQAGVVVHPLDHEGSTRTKTRVRCAGQSLVRLDDGGPGRPAGDLSPDALAAIQQAGAVLVSDYGAGAASHPGTRDAVAQAAGRHTPAPVVWDPHPRGGVPVAGCTLVVPNLAEAAAALDASTTAHPADLASELRERWGAGALAVTCGADGAWLATVEEAPRFIPARAAESGDPCGAGDRFAAGAVRALLDGALPSEAVLAAVGEASAWVAAGGAAALAHGGSANLSSPATGRDAAHLPGRGTVVATGGCFDVLHAGHVATLEAARALGDRLVVLLNSDASVRRLKGPGRPVQSAPDRERVLRGLTCVDDVVVFDDDDPRQALDRLRPDIWAKGGDYSESTLPETELVRSWGGRVVLLPYLPGRSTTGVLTAGR